MSKDHSDIHTNILVCRGGGEYSQKNLLGVCSLFPKTLTLFVTKISDFPYPIYDLTKTLIRYVHDCMTVEAGKVAPKIVYEGLLLLVLSVLMKKQLLLRNHDQFKTGVQKQYSICDQMAKIEVLFMTKMVQKPYPFDAAHTYIAGSHWSSRGYML